MNTLEAITKSKSHRQFKAESLNEEQLNVLMKAGLCAPSSENEDPWYLVGLLNKEKVDALNKDICDAHQDNKDHFYGAPNAIVVCVNKNAKTPVVDGATCTQNILLAAEDLNLASCWIDGVLALNESDVFKDYVTQYKLPEGYEFRSAIAVGQRVNTPEPKVISEEKIYIVK